jgi:hypothetical protein
MISCRVTDPEALRFATGFRDDWVDWVDSEWFRPSDNLMAFIAAIPVNEYTNAVCTPISNTAVKRVAAHPHLMGIIHLTPQSLSDTIGTVGDSE